MLNVKIISQIKLLAAGMIFITCGSAFGSGSCGSVFTSSSVASDAGLIQELAKLKLHIDTEKTSGEDGVVNLTPVLQKSFEIKFKELVANHRGKLTEQQVKMLIRDEIIRQQKFDSETNKKAEESVRRSSEQIALEILKFKFDRSLFTDIPKTITSELFAEYLPETNSIYWLEPIRNANRDGTVGFNLQKYNLSTGQTSTLANDLTAITQLSDPTHVLMMTTAGFTRRLDLVKEKLVSEIDTRLPDGRILNRAHNDKDKAGKLAVNSSGTVLAISEGYRIYFFEVSTGKFLDMFENRGGFNSWVANIRFVSEKEAIFNTGGTIVKYNFEKGEASTMEIFDTVGVFGLETSRDGQIISMMNLFEVVNIKTSDLSIVERIRVFENQHGARSRQFKRVANTANQIIHVGSKHVPRMGIYSQEDLIGPSFVFNDPRASMDNREIITIMISPDHKRVFVLSVEELKPRLDIWNYDQ
jgi:hypothetical protein